VTRLVRAELLKLVTARTFWGLACATVGLVVLITVLTLAVDSDLSSESDVRSLLSTAGASGLLLLVLGWSSAPASTATAPSPGRCW
jgi:hypothetical protein